MMTSGGPAALAAGAGLLSSQQAMRDRSIPHLSDALALMPLKHRAAFDEAMRRCPALVGQESNPMQFLASQGFHALQASSRLVTYWSLRQRDLGEDAFSPLSKNPASLGSSDLVELPVRDRFGRRVLYHKITTLLEPLDMKTVYSLLSSRPSREQHTQHSSGYEVVLVVHLTPEVLLQRSATLFDVRLQLLLSGGMPWSLHAVHFVCCLSPQQRLLLDLRALLTPVVLPELARLTVVHTCTTLADARERLQGCGLLQEGLPVSLGGTLGATACAPGFSLQAPNVLLHDRKMSPSERMFVLQQQQQQSALPSSAQVSALPLGAGPPLVPERQDGEDHLLQAHASVATGPVLRDAAALCGAAGGGVSPTLSSNVTPQQNLNGVLGPIQVEAQFNFTETVTVQNQGLRQLGEAMAGLPAEEKAAYETAVRYAPFLVETESSPLRYLRFDSYNAWAAATRLASYWKCRVDTFGERAFLPLTLSGEGALTPEDVEAFKSGWISILPNDSSGRSVICLDIQKRPKHAFSSDVRMRVGFYAMSLVCENPLSHSPTGGFIGCLIFGVPDFGSTLDSTNKKGADLTLSCFTTFAHKYHLVNSPSGFCERIFFGLLLPLAFRLMRALVKEDKAFIHSGSQTELAAKISAFGLKALPDTVGGTYTNEEHMKWFQNRRRVEERRYHAMNSVTGNDAPKLTAVAPMLAVAANANSRQSVPNTHAPDRPATKQQPRLSFPLANSPNRDIAAAAAAAAPLDSQPLVQAKVKNGLKPSITQGQPEANKRINHDAIRNGAAHAKSSSEEAMRHFGTVATASPLLSAKPQDCPSQPPQQQQRDQRRSEVLRAMEEVPDAEKAAFTQVMAAAPELIPRESKPESFLRQNCYALDAAKRLAKYWQVRKQIFESNAFLPLNQTAEGALDRRDLGVLSSAFLMILPKDKNGRSVLFCDCARLVKSTRQSRLRSTFYMYAIASEAEAQEDGFILIYVLTEPSCDRENKDYLDMILPAMPATIRDIHLIRCQEDAASTRHMGLQQQLEPHELEGFRSLAANQVIEHNVERRTSLAKRLAQYGLDPNGLPKSIGGRFGLNQFFQWQELRTRYEWDLPAGVCSKQEVALFDFCKSKPATEMTAQEKYEKKRKLNVIHSRRKRERERIEVEVLNEQTAELKEENGSLLEENRRLQLLLEQALSRAQQIHILEDSHF